MAKYTIGMGTVISIQKDGDSTWTPIKGGQSLTLSGAESSDIDVTNFGSGGKREYIKGITEYTDFELNGVWNGGDAQDTLLRGYQLSGEDIKIRLQIPAVDDDGDTSTFTIAYEGYVKTYSNEIDYENAGSYTLGVKVNAVDLTPSA